MDNECGVPAESLDWLAEFRQRQGRPPRVLHIGNIANNAYVCSKILNRAGLWSDVLCYDYYHMMGCPEWEESNYAGNIRSDFYPAWEEVDLRLYERPRWFAQGPLPACIDYLVARCDGRPDTDHCWERLSQQRRQACAELRGEGRPQREAAGPTSHHTPHGPVQRCPRLRGLLGPAYAPLRAVAWQLIHAFQKTSRGGRWLLECPTHLPLAKDAHPAEATYHRRVRELCRVYADLFPERSHPLQPADLQGYISALPLWESLIRRYDIVIGYATDGIFPLLVNSCPYFALEHGTIRNIPFQDTTQGKLCALTYRLANTSLITNCDNMQAADRLRLATFRFLPHPINEDLKPTVRPESLREELRQRLNCDFLLFHPSRHHWTAERHPDWEKGNDILMEGFATFLQRTCPKAGAVFVEWGQKVGESRVLLERLGLSDRVLWIPPQPMARMLDYIRASDVLADQFFLGAFGGITPKALMLGCPTLLYLNEEHHRRCFPVLPPLINAHTPAQVFAGLTRLYRDPGYAASLRVEGRKWYQQYHSNRRILSDLLESFRGALSRETPARIEHAGLPAPVLMT